MTENKTTGSKVGFITNLIAGIINALLSMFLFLFACLLKANWSQKEVFLEGVREGLGLEKGADISAAIDYLGNIFFIFSAMLLFYAVIGIYLSIRFKKGNYSVGIAIFAIIMGSIYTFYYLFSIEITGIIVGLLMVVGSSFALSDIDKIEGEKGFENEKEPKTKKKVTTKKPSKTKK